MCQLVESIKLKDGKILHLSYHQNRMNRSVEELYPGARPIDLAKAIVIPENFRTGLFKVRVLYRQTIEKVEIDPYNFRTIQSLKVVQHESIDYHLKYTDREILQQLFALRGNCNDIIIIKNGLVTDSFAANLLFFDGQNWVTPTTPLLKGTQRQFLLEQGIILEKEIREEDIRSYQKIGLINAMVDFDEMPVININSIVY
ncbi:MAG: aminotransferase class IV [Prolixibacteraceae bacterium]|nr:aminotransferase class IV [Prolixibacteraceae bacterium]